MLTHYNKWEEFSWNDYMTWASWVVHYANTSEAQIRADCAWQAAFDGVMAGVDEEICELVLYLRYGEPVELDVRMSEWNEYLASKHGACKSVYVGHSGWGYWPFA